MSIRPVDEQPCNDSAIAVQYLGVCRLALFGHHNATWGLPTCQASPSQLRVQRAHCGSRRFDKCATASSKHNHATAIDQRFNGGAATHRINSFKTGHRNHHGGFKPDAYRVIDGHMLPAVCTFGMLCKGVGKAASQHRWWGINIVDKHGSAERDTATVQHKQAKAQLA
jgi:hypothetical protein